eukprot:3856909-Amphidinium_carterae.1
MSYPFQFFGWFWGVADQNPRICAGHSGSPSRCRLLSLVLEVTLYEDVARNPISAFAQSTRWLLGEAFSQVLHPLRPESPTSPIFSLVFDLPIRFCMRHRVAPKMMYVRQCAVSQLYQQVLHVKSST